MKNFLFIQLKIFFVLIFVLIKSINVFAGIHTVPIVIPAQMIRSAQYHPLKMYRVFKSTKDGIAIPIPFQIDEKDIYGDYILPEGILPNTGQSNGIFDFRDELSVMGNDVGVVKTPTKWNFKKPSVLYEVKFKNKLTNKLGAIYIGAYFKNPPEKSEQRYVNFSVKNAEVVTSRYRYRFDRDNYLVVRGIDINKVREKKDPVKLIDSSTLFLKADLKYFLTLKVNQDDIESELEAYKIGPIRCVARVNFTYKFLKLNFDLGMYTEISFFSNSVILPAVVDNPLDGEKILNKGSQFYYGFSFVDNPWTLKIDTNMPEYKEKNVLDFLKGKKKVENQYWFSASSNDYMIYVEMEPSVQMQNTGNVPMFYRENTPSQMMKKRTKSAAPLGKSPVNFAISVDLASFSEGLHNISIRLFVENFNNQDLLDEYKTINDWKISTVRLPSKSFSK